MPIDVYEVVLGDDEAVSMPRDVVAKERIQTPSIRASGCDCHDNHHDPADSHDHTKHHRLSWLSSRLGRATSKGLGCGLISAIIFTPCPCCGGVILACLRGLLSAAIGLMVGVFTYRRRSATATPNRYVVSPGAALERK